MDDTPDHHQWRFTRHSRPVVHPDSSRHASRGPLWAYEIKHDGFRFICRRDGRVRVFSRRGHDWTDRVPRIADDMAGLLVTSITLHAEGVVCGRDGVSDFDLMRAAVGRKGSLAAFSYAFDLLEQDGAGLRRERWDARRERRKAPAQSRARDRRVRAGPAF